MPPDPNARLTKAVEDLTRAVSENTKVLKDVLKNGRRVQFTNHPYFKENDVGEVGSGSADIEGENATAGGSHR